MTFFTDEFGKVKAMAKGARRSRKRFANALENGYLVGIVFSRREREGLALLEACDVMDHFPGIRSDLEKSLMAAYFSELVDLFTLEGKKNKNLFDHLFDFLTFLDNRGLSEGMVRLFELRLLKLQGYEPVLDRCVACKRPLDELSRIFFNVSEGGVRCGTCDRGTGEVRRLSPGTVKMLLLGKSMNMDKLPQLIFSPGALAESRDLHLLYPAYPGQGGEVFECPQ
jgi:DNA repair protein RecO (recombination protein O)